MKRSHLWISPNTNYLLQELKVGRKLTTTQVFIQALECFKKTFFEKPEIYNLLKKYPYKEEKATIQLNFRNIVILEKIKKIPLKYNIKLKIGVCVWVLLINFYYNNNFLEDYSKDIVTQWKEFVHWLDITSKYNIN